MVHARERHIVPLLTKRLKFSPVLAIQGARQTGKSFLVREILAKRLRGLEYVSFDAKSEREFAARNPDTFLEQHQAAKHLAIDEAQKVPDIFDAIKFKVDRSRAPGQFILLGSTEFSKLTLIRESLTGRMSRVRVFPLSIGESLKLPPNRSAQEFFIQQKARVLRADFLRYLTRGGMPGIFWVKDGQQRQQMLRDWLELTVMRDIHTIPRKKLDSDLALSILQQLAVADEPDLPTLVRKTRRDARRIQTHLDALLTLFVITALPAHPAGSGKTYYFLCDVSFAAALGASFERQLHTCVLQEQLAQMSYRSNYTGSLFYYRTSKGRVIHLVEELQGKANAALKILSDETVLDRDLAILRAFRDKIGSPVKLLALGVSAQKRSGAVSVLPWESIA